MRCARCVLAEHKPDIWLDKNNVCNVCASRPSLERAPAGPAGFLETDLTNILKKTKKKGPYDCLVMCSGGKDSTAALYYAKKRYHLRPLAFTFDHGFGSPQAFENVKNAVDTLHVDWMYVRSDFMHGFFADLIKTKAPVPICPPCSLWYMSLTYDIAARHDIPLILGGWTRGQMSSNGQTGFDGNLPSEPEFSGLTAATSEFTNRVRRTHPQYRDFPVSMSQVQKKYKKIKTFSPHWFLREDPEDYSNVIKKQLGWKPSAVSYPLNSTNCTLNFVGVYLSLKYYDFTHYHIEMSNLIRRGELSRQEAMAALELDIEREPVKSVVADTLKTLGCSWDDLVT